MKSKDSFAISRRSALTALASTGLLGELEIQSSITATQGEFTSAINFYRGPLSERPSAGDANRIWIAEETGGVYYDDGSSWSKVNREFNSISAEQLLNVKAHGNILFVGDGGWWDELSAALEFIDDATSDNKYTIHITSNITDSSTIAAKSHVNIEGNSYTVTSTVDTEYTGQGGSTEIQCIAVSNVKNSTIQNLTVRHEPASSIGRGYAIRVFQNCQDTLRFKNIRAIGHSTSHGGYGWQVRHHTNPEFIDCVGIGGESSSAVGWHVIHGTVAKFKGCIGYGGLGGRHCHGWYIENAAAPEMESCVGIGGMDGNNCHGYHVVGNASPKMTNCVGKYKSGSFFEHFEGSGSVGALTGETVDDKTTETRIPDSGSNACFLVSIEVRVVQAGNNNATLDLGTSSGGAQIASEIPIDTVSRQVFDYSQVQFFAGDKIYITMSDESAVCNIRWTVAMSQGGCHGLHLDTYGETNINGGKFLGGFRSNGVNIGQNATTAKKYTLSNALCKTIDTSHKNGIVGTSDSNAEDPIAGCTVVGGTANINGTNIANI